MTDFTASKILYGSLHPQRLHVEQIPIYIYSVGITKDGMSIDEFRDRLKSFLPLAPGAHYLFATEQQDNLNVELARHKVIGDEIVSTLKKALNRPDGPLNPVGTECGLIGAICRNIVLGMNRGVRDEILGFGLNPIAVFDHYPGPILCGDRFVTANLDGNQQMVLVTDYDTYTLEINPDLIDLTKMPTDSA